MNNSWWTELEAPAKEEPVAAWMLTFSDLVALLLCFFVLMFSMRELDMKGWDELRGSIAGVFTTLVSETEAVPAVEMPDAEVVVRRKGSVLPYLMQVWQQKTAADAVWSTAAVNYSAENGEIWIAWPVGANGRLAADILMKWRNRVRLVANSAPDAAVALGYLQALKQSGVMVAKEVRMTPGVAPGVWLVVEDKQ